MPVATAAILVLAAVARPVILLWTRGEVSVSVQVVVLMAAWTWLWCWGQTFAFLQNGLGRIRVQWLTGGVSPS